MEYTTLILTYSETQALYYVLHQLLSWPSLSPLCLYDDEEKALATLYDKLSAERNI